MQQSGHHLLVFERHTIDRSGQEGRTAARNQGDHDVARLGGAATRLEHLQCAFDAGRCGFIAAGGTCDVELDRVQWQFGSSGDIDNAVVGALAMVFRSGSGFPLESVSESVLALGFPLELALGFPLEPALGFPLGSESVSPVALLW